MNGLEVVVLVRSGGCYAFFRKSKTSPFAALSFSLVPSDSLVDVLPGLITEVGTLFFALVAVVRYVS